MHEDQTSTDRVVPPRRLLFSARKLQLIGAVGMVAYVILSTSAAFVILGPSTHPYRELYPFFSWSLFSKVSDLRSEYHIAVSALDGETLDPPVDMRSIDAFPRFADSKSLGFKALQNLGDALRRGDQSAPTIREHFAARFFGDHDVEYRIDRHVYNPLKRWREGPSSDDVEVMGHFSHEDGS